MRSIRISELAGAAGFFHGACKDKFRAGLDNEASTAWDSIVNNRHGVAHEESSGEDPVISTLTFGELTALYPKALTVLDCLRAAIALDEGDDAVGSE